LIDVVQGDGIAGVVSFYVSGLRVKQFLGIAVVGGD